MRELGGNMITEDGIKIEWMNHLPAQIRVVLSVNTDSSLDMLAAMADKMMEYSESSNIAAVSSSQPDSVAVNQQVMSAQIQVLSKQLEKLTLEISELRSRGRPHHRRYQRSRSRSKSTAKYQNDSNRYPDLLRPMSLKTPAKHNVVHHIETTGPPLFARARPLPPDKYKAAKEEFERVRKGTFLLDNRATLLSRDCHYFSPSDFVLKLNV
ncbi:hypothetical protein HW555_011669 [Spodoptera exigua]|uniref:Uncharacterized protein n=1 Tax=Spodoptera exigua TaxID=7107 RepID=A0A835G845_SPOEX|nr:hypothetical protein HW555_011669 [Spodoptera exigua]